MHDLYLTHNHYLSSKNWTKWHFMVSLMHSSALILDLICFSLIDSNTVFEAEFWWKKSAKHIVSKYWICSRIGCMCSSKISTLIFSYDRALHEFHFYCYNPTFISLTNNQFFISGIIKWLTFYNLLVLCVFVLSLVWKLCLLLP